VLLAKLGPILEDPESVICDDGSGSAPLALIDGPVLCTVVPFENQGADSSEFPDGTTGIKIEPFCKNAYTSPGIECDYCPAGNCDLVAAPAIPSLAANNNNLFVGTDQTRTLAPGAYGTVTVHPRGRLRLSAGDYAFQTIELHSTSHLDLNKAGGPIRIVVYQSAKLQANYNHSSPNTAAGFILAYVGTQTAIAETQFRGTLVVPNGSLNLRALNSQSHEGEFFAKNLKTEGGATVRHVPGTCVSP
jgi:hypothetical protein